MFQCTVQSKKKERKKERKKNTRAHTLFICIATRPFRIKIEGEKCLVNAQNRDAYGKSEENDKMLG